MSDDRDAEEFDEEPSLEPRQQRLERLFSKAEREFSNVSRAIHEELTLVEISIQHEIEKLITTADPNWAAEADREAAALIERLVQAAKSPRQR